ncbi:hypothetical protein [Komagataeibacter saccharivorans]|nr:hypothetical protein [Komagataeibacter saccharivorans]
MLPSGGMVRGNNIGMDGRLDFRRSSPATTRPYPTMAHATIVKTGRLVEN